MRRAAVGPLVAALFAAPSFALTVSGVETGGDSLVFCTDMAVKYRGLTEEAFGQIDTRDDEFVDEAELAAPPDAGLIKEPAE